MPGEEKTVEFLADSQTRATGAALIALGISIIGLAFVLLSASVMFVPLASSRPRGSRRRHQNRAHVRVAAVALALDASSNPLPADQIVDNVAKRGRIVARTHMLLMFQLTVMSLGFLAASWGLLLRDYVGSHSDISLESTTRLLTLIATYLLFLGISIGIQQWVWNRHPEYFATHHLLRGLELMLNLRPDASNKGKDIDFGQVRQDAVSTLGQSAVYVRRWKGRRLPFVGAEELDNARRRAAELARAITGYQEILIFGSPQEIVALIPDVSQTLAALVEQRFGDLPRGAGAELLSDRDYSWASGRGAAAESTATSSGAGSHRPPGDDFSPEDVDELRREMARVYASATDADLVLTRAGYPRERRPNIEYHHPEAAWWEIFRELGNGIIDDPYRTMLARALETYRGNPTFVDLARRYDVPVPATRRLTRRTRWAKPVVRRPRF